MMLENSNKKQNRIASNQINVNTSDTRKSSVTSWNEGSLKRVLIAILAVGLVLLCGSLSSNAQLSTATMFGTVTDSTGAVVPNAAITLVQTDTNFTRVAVSKADGSFREEFLPVGPYKVTVTATGFKTLDRAGIVLSVMQDAELTLQLELGATTETVNVTADVPLVNLGSATLGRTISNLEIDNLPLVGRDTYTLLYLVPGVQ